MSLLPSLDPASDDAAESDLLYTVQTAGPRKRTFGSLWRNVLGRTAASARGFFGASPITQPASVNQAAVTASMGAAVITTPATNTSPYGFATAGQADDIVARVNEAKTLGEQNKVLLNEMRANLVALGLIKGSA